MLHKTLTTLGLDEKAIDIYLELLKTGPTRASDLAKRLHLPRTTVQNILARLEDEKLASKAPHKNAFIFSATHPENLIKVAQMKKRELDNKYEQLIHTLNKIAPELIGIMKSSKPIPRVKFYQGKSAVKHVLYDTLTSKTELKGLANIDAMYRHVKEINDTYVAEREKTDIKKRGLLLDTPFAREVHKLKSYSPKSYVGQKWIDAHRYPFSTEVNVYDNKVSFLTYVENDFVGIIIENEHIYQTMASLWQLVWDLLPGENHKK